MCRVTLGRREAAVTNLTIFANVDQGDRKLAADLRLTAPGLRCTADIQHAGLRRWREEGVKAVHALASKMDKYVITEATEGKFHRFLFSFLHGIRPSYGWTACLFPPTRQPRHCNPRLKRQRQRVAVDGAAVSMLLLNSFREFVSRQLPKQWP